jgi:hypothetical protein
MNRRKPLTPTSKAYYMEEFQKALRCKDSYWGIDPEIREELTAINKNPNIQTLNSAFFSNHSTSYLHYAFSQNLEAQQETILKNFQAFQKEIQERTPRSLKINAMMSFTPWEEYQHPNLPKDIADDENFGLDMVENIQKYTNTDAMILLFTHPLRYMHEEFWDFITKQLSPL